VNGAGLGGSIERTQGVLQGRDGITGLAARGDLDGLGHERLGGAPAGLVDL